MFSDLAIGWKEPGRERRHGVVGDPLPVQDGAGDQRAALRGAGAPRVRHQGALEMVMVMSETGGKKTDGRVDGRDARADRGGDVQLQTSHCVGYV